MRIKNVLTHRNRTLLRELVVTDFKLRYQASVLGYLWSLVRPLFLFGILLVVFGYVVRIGTAVPHYPIYLLLGIVFWNFFIEATNNGLKAVVGQRDLIRKVNFPKYLIVISGTISALINLAISLVVVFLFMAFSHVGLRPVALLLPLVILEFYVFALALAFFLSALYVKYRDVSYIWELLLQAGFYATPIIYPLSLVSDKSKLLAKLMMLSPMAQIVQDARYILVTPQTETLAQLSHNHLVILVPFLVVVALTATSSMYFRKNSKYFAENA